MYGRLSGTALGPEIESEMAVTRRYREAYSLLVQGDRLLAAGRPAPALRRYLEIKARYADTPSASEIDERIAAARREQ